MQFTINQNGQIQYVDHGPLGAALTAEAGTRVERRASHVEPASGPLRALFRAIRKRVRDDSLAARFTRIWPVRWRVTIIGGPTFGPFRRRADAIRAEIEWLEDNQLGRRRKKRRLRRNSGGGNTWRHTMPFAEWFRNFGSGLWNEANR